LIADSSGGRGPSGGNCPEVCAIETWGRAAARLAVGGGA